MDKPVMMITGTSKGIGRALAEYYCGAGFQVAGCSRGDATLENDSYLHTMVDVRHESQVKRWVHHIKKSWRRIDVLICNAGSAPVALLQTMTSGEILDDVMQTNIAGTYYVCRETAQVMMSRKAGRIITVSSMAVGLHDPGTTAYSASKSAIVEMTKILAKELIPFGITCNVIAPSIIQSDAVEAMGDEGINRAIAKLTLQRMLTVPEICNVISFYIAPESRCITGQVIHMGLVV